MNNEEIKKTLSNILAYLAIDGVKLNPAQVNFIYSSLILIYYDGKNKANEETMDIWNEIDGINRTAEEQI